jgi:hypothetical protein
MALTHRPMQVDGLQPIRIKLSLPHCDDDNAGRGLQPRLKRLYFDNFET